MACPTSQDCIAVGEDGLAEVSNNSGLSWYAEATGTNKRLLGISCVSSSACIAVGDKGIIIRTADDGITWQRVRSGTSEGLTGISCANSTTCIISGQLGSIFRSIDAGASWKLEESFEAELTSVSCFRVLCAALSLRVSLDSPAQAFVSNDSGSSWLGESLSQDVNFYGVSCYNKHSCYAVGDQGTFERTTDYGYIWHQVTVNDFGTINSISCASSSRCVAGGQFGQMFYTAHNTWKPLNIGVGSSSHQTIESIDCRGLTLCLAVGDQGTISRSSKWTSAWRTVHLSLASGFSRVLLVGDSVAQTFGTELPPLAQPFHLYFEDEGILGCGIAQGEPVEAAGVVYKAVASPCNGQPGTPQWPAYWTQYITELHPKVAILLAGFWEVTNRMFDGVWSNISQPNYQAYILGQIQLAVKVLSQDNTKVVLLTSPYFDTGNYPEDNPTRVDIYNSLLEQVAKQYPTQVSVFDLNQYIDPGGKYTSTIDGIQIRQNDGEHFTTQGSKFIAKWLLPQIQHLVSP